MSSNGTRLRGWRYSLSLVLAGLLSGLVAGCGPGEQEKVTVHGKVTDNGTPVSVDPQKGIAQVEFRRIEGGEVVDVPRADIRADGTYSVDIPPGKYRVIVNKQPTYPGPNEYARIFPEGGSPLEVDIEDDRELNIEVNEYRK